MDRQDLIKDLVRVAQMFHDQPLTRALYRKHGKFGDSSFTRYFHSWNRALKSAGLDINHDRIACPKRKKCNHVIAIGDKHFPYENQIVLNRILDDIEKKQPDIVIQLGDLYDFYSFGRFPRSHNLYTPQMEIELGRNKAERFWAEVRKRAPKARLFQLWGNHDDRVVKRILEKSPEHSQFVEKGMRDLMTFGGVTTMFDSREELVIDDVWYVHGYLSQLGMHARKMGKRVVCGHSHLGGVAYIKLEKQIIWECNAGWTGNRFALACSYTAQRRMSNWTTGYAEIDEDGPRFIPVFAEATR